MAACGDDDAGAHDAGASPADAAVDATPPTAMTFHTRVGFRAASVPFFAFQDGDGPWQAVEGDGGSYQVGRLSDRFGVAWACTVTVGDVVSHGVMVLYAAENDTLPATLDCEEPEVVEFDVSVAGLAALEEVGVSVRGGSADGLTSVGSIATDVLAPPGAQEAVAVRRDDTDDIIDVAFARDLDFDQSTGNDVAIDFTGGGAAVLELEPVDPSGAYTTTFHGARGASVILGLETVVLHVEDAALEPDDVHEWYQTGGGGLELWFSHAGDIAPEFDPPQDGADGTFDQLDGDTPRFAADFDAPDDATVWVLRASQGVTEELARRWMVSASAAWLDGTTVVAMPDLAGLDGWDDAWSLDPSLSISLLGYAESSSRGVPGAAPYHLARRYTAADDGAHAILYKSFNDIIDP